MARQLLISADPGEWRAALLEKGVPVELYVERGDRSAAGSIHLGRVVRLLPALGAALIDIGSDRPAFLRQSEVLPHGKRLHEGERVIVQIRREAQAGKAARVRMAQRWSGLLDRAARLDPPARLDPAASSAAALAGSLPGAPDEILVDDPAAIPELRAGFPDSAITHLPEAEWPIDLDGVFEEALSAKLALSGGGSVHLAATRAGTLIDVDTGTPETGSPERTGLMANLAAAAAIARQIRLRNLGGGIVVDFVGMDSRSAREKLRTAFAEALAPDPATPQLLGWTRLGHFELVRPRRARPLAELLLEPRSGGPLVKTAVTVAREALRALRRAVRAQPGRQWRLTAAPEVAAALSGPVADAVRQAEQRFARSIVIEPDPECERESFQISAF